MIEINKTYNEDCLITMGRMTDCFIDLVVTSPPYDNLRDYRNYSFSFEAIAVELFRVIKEGGVVVWVVGDSCIKGSESGTSFRQALFFKEIGFNLHDTMIYEKSGLPHLSNRYEQEFEYMFVLSKGKPNTFNPLMKKNKTAGLKNPSRSQRQKNGTLKKISNHTTKEYGTKGNVWKYKVGFNNSTKDNFAFKHPAIFPEKLAEDHILSWSNAGDIVYDPFMGSGTTAKMALKVRRRYIGNEISQEYSEIIQKRLCQGFLPIL